MTARELLEQRIYLRIRIVLAPSEHAWRADWAAGTRARPYRMLGMRVAGRAST